MKFEDYVYKLRGVDPDAKRAYVALFNSTSNRNTGRKVLNDLMIKFRFYGSKPTNDPILLAKQAAYREIIEYMLTMAARVSEDTLSEIETFINKGGTDE
jgi:hypothetical protein